VHIYSFSSPKQFKPPIKVIDPTKAVKTQHVLKNRLRNLKKEKRKKTKSEKTRGD